MTSPQPTPSSFPLIAPERVRLPIAQHDTRGVTGERFLAEAAAVAETLPERGHAINLCTNRYHFLLGFAAALIRGQTMLLPPNRARSMLAKIAAVYPHSYTLVDEQEPDNGTESVLLRVPPDPPSPGRVDNPLIRADHPAAVVFTSGSTGEPQPHLKTWNTFCRSGELIAAGLGVAAHTGHYALATVPAQHMYGLETSILLVLRSGTVLTDARAFYPADIDDALASIPEPRMLITTPVHLRACLESGYRGAPVDLIVSATAPLSPALAQAAEQSFRGRLVEIYGYTEAGSIAIRRTATEELWRLFPGLSLGLENGRCVLAAPYLDAPTYPQDRIELVDDDSFRLLGRLSDQVNIAGKRTSLGALDAALCALPGVVDGVFFMPDQPETEARIPRLTAFAVAPGWTAEDLLAALRDRLDPAFLPRPLLLVETLPRLANGKLMRRDLQGLAACCNRADDQPDR